MDVRERADRRIKKVGEVAIGGGRNRDLGQIILVGKWQPNALRLRNSPCNRRLNNVPLAADYQVHLINISVRTVGVRVAIACTSKTDSLNLIAHVQRLARLAAIALM